MIRFAGVVVGTVIAVVAAAGQAWAQSAAEPQRIRGEIAAVGAASLDIRTKSGRIVRLSLPADVTIIALSKASFGEIAFGTYVGTVAKRLDAYPPEVRDSKSWLHRAFELRIVDEDLRGIALGAKPWDLPPGSIVAHGWVDDIEDRILSVKYGPTDDDETDVEVPADVPIHRMSSADRAILKRGARVVAGSRRVAGRGDIAVFVIVGTRGVVPAL